ncbi:hypothetical protein MINTM007_31600 [Mycobacterium intracellulare]|nr:hypothetical protein MINTM007_31600 [Mycobacterium intracellulare]
MLDALDVGQRGTDLAQLDAVAADLDLLVGTADVLQLPVGAPPDEVTGAIHPRAGRTEGAGHESGGRQPRAAHVAGGQSPTGDVQLADHPDRHRAQPPIEHEEGEVAQRHPDRAHVVVDVAAKDLAERRVHRGLGDAVHVDHPRQAGMVMQPRRQPARLQRLPTEHHRLQLQLLTQLRGQRVGTLQRIERRRRLAEHADLLANQQGAQVIW